MQLVDVGMAKFHIYLKYYTYSAELGILPSFISLESRYRGVREKETAEKWGRGKEGKEAEKLSNWSQKAARYTLHKTSSCTCSTS
jgi:hypothetical protein